MKKKSWKYRSRTEKEYERILKQFKNYLRKTILKLATIQEIITSVENIQHEPWFLSFAKKEALKMVKSCLVENAQAWREAAKEGQRSHEIHHLLKNEFQHNHRFQELVQRNAGYIKTLPQSIANAASKKAARAALAGERTEDIVNFIKQQVPETADWQAQRIARTEVAKTQSAITQIRSEAVGIKWYVWRTSEDGRVRESHRKMDGVLCQFNDPPSPEALAGETPIGHYGPGEVFNCRCYAEPLIENDDFQPNSKVCFGNRIQRMSKRQFLEISE